MSHAISSYNRHLFIPRSSKTRTQATPFIFSILSWIFCPFHNVFFFQSITKLAHSSLGNREDAFIYLFIIKSEVSTFPIVSYFFMVVYLRCIYFKLFIIQLLTHTLLSKTVAKPSLNCGYEWLLYPQRKLYIHLRSLMDPWKSTSVTQFVNLDLCRHIASITSGPNELSAFTIWNYDQRVA